jgi:hypothetical protein
MTKLLALGTAITMLAVSACGGTDAIGPKDVAGIYHLETVNGAVLPATVVQTATSTLQIVSSAYYLYSNGTYVAVTDLNETSSGVVTPRAWTENGTFWLHGSSVTFNVTPGPGVDGVIAGDELTLPQIGQVASNVVFRREP